MYSRIKDSSSFLIVFLFILCLSLILTTFYIKNKNRVVDVSLSSRSNNSISIKSKITMDDDHGKAIYYDKSKDKFQGYLEFEVVSKSTVKSKYEIYAVEDDNVIIHPNYVKVYLTDENDNPVSGYEDFAVPTFYNLRVSSLNPKGKRLYYGTINPNEAKKYKLRVWFSDSYKLEQEDKNFSIKLFVEADS